MESTNEARLPSRFPIVKQQDLTGLRECIGLLGPIERMSFEETYGNLLMLLRLEVQVSAVVALSQCYDSEARCFLFKDCYLAPTLEEYTQILGFPQLSIVPYQYQKPYYSDEAFASLLHVSLEELKLQKITRNEVTVFPQKYFEGRLRFLAQAKSWNPFKTLLAMTIFGAILFPQIDGYISTAAVGMFLAFKDKDKPINPIPAILADTYCTFTHYAELRGKRVSCSLHVLYAWLLTHVFINKAGFVTLTDYAVGCTVPTMSSHEWLQLLSGLEGSKVRWFIPVCWEDRPKVLFQCGTFQNVPLMGTKGCINYNPSLALRQLGYPLRSAPTNEMLFRFYLHEKNSRDEGLIRRVLQSWEKMVYKGKLDLAKKISNEQVTFNQWLQGRIQRVRLPSQRVLRVEERIAEPKSTAERLEEYKAALSLANEEKKSLQEELEKLVLRNKELEDKNAFKSMAVEESKKQVERGEKEKQETRKYLKTAKEELKRCNLKAKKAIEEADEWKNQWEKAKMDERAARSALAKSKNESRMVLAEWKEQLKSIKQERNAIEGALKECQQAWRFEQGRSVELQRNLRCLEEAYRQVRVESQYWEHRFVELLGRIEEQEVIIELKGEIQHWKDKFSKLSMLANQAITGVPRNLRKAEAEMHILNTPPEVYEFVKFCRALVTEVRAKTQGAAAGKKRKRDGDLKALCI